MMESMLLTLWLMSASMPEGCAVTGTVFHSTEQTFALLRSDCLIDIERQDRWIIMTSPRWVVAVEIPPTFGKRQFTYSWGSPWALFGAGPTTSEWIPDPKSNRPNPSDSQTSNAVFCLNTDLEF